MLFSLWGPTPDNAETAIVSIEYLYRQRLLRIEDLTVRDTRVLELCYRTQGVAGLTSLNYLVVNTLVGCNAGYGGSDWTGESLMESIDS